VPFDLAIDFVEEIRAWAPQGMSMAQMAMRWVLDHKEVSTFITGAGRVELVIENALVSDLKPLPAELHEKLRAFYRSRIEATIYVPI
jgi:aryl-alcohol dehydrogenase-like predicted oxidoreductase